MRKKLAFGVLAALTTAAAVLPAAPATASCTKPVDDDLIRCAEAPVCLVGSKLGLQCVD